MRSMHSMAAARLMPYTAMVLVVQQTLSQHPLPLLNRFFLACQAWMAVALGHAAHQRSCSKAMQHRSSSEHTTVLCGVF